MENRTVLVVVLAASACIAQASSVTLVDPSFETTAMTVYTSQSNLIASNPNTVGLGWFSDWTTTQAKSGQNVVPSPAWGGTGTSTFWKVAGGDGLKAAFAGGFTSGPGFGASLMQTVYLDAGNKYTLKALAGTGDHVDPAKSLNVAKQNAYCGLAFLSSPLVGFLPTGYAVSTFAETARDAAHVLPDREAVFHEFSLDFTPATSGYYNIALRNEGFVDGSTIYAPTSTVFFDNVRLDYTPVPEPSMTLLLLGGVGVLARRRSR